MAQQENNIILSVKVAASGVEKYIAKCLESFIDERYMDDIEVIVINNKCEDKTLNIIEQYEKKYPNLFKVIRQEDRGYGSTYNVGIELAKGKYFAVLDGDDWYDKDALYKLLRKLKQHNSDLIISDAMGVYNDERKKYCYEGMEENVIYSITDILEKKLFFSFHMFVIKTQILKENCIVVDEACIVPDVQYDMYILPLIHSIEFMRTPLYYYRTGGANQATGIAKESARAMNICSTIVDLIKWKNNNSMEEDVEKYLELKLAKYVNIGVSKLLLRKVCRESYKDIICFIENIKGMDLNIFCNTNILVKSLYRSVLGRCIYPFLAYAYKQYCKNKKFNW